MQWSIGMRFGVPRDDLLLFLCRFGLKTVECFAWNCLPGSKKRPSKKFAGGAFQIRSPMESLADRFGLEGIVVQVSRRVHEDNLEA